MRSPPMWRNPKLPDPTTLRKLPLAPPPAEAAVTSDRALGESNSSPLAALAIISDFTRSFASGSIFTTLPPTAVASGTVTGIRHLEIKRGRVRAASGPGIVSFAKRCVAISTFSRAPLYWRSERVSKIADMGREMVRAPVLAAGGIVLRREGTPLIAVVRLRKRNEWVLPKGKLDDGETPRAAAEREVIEETGHDVSVHEFLGTLVYESGGRSKVVHYWRMATDGEPAYDLMDDVRAVDWLPLDAAVARLSRGYERAFLANVGPLALQAAALARPARRPKAKRPAPDKRRGRQVVVTPPSFGISVSVPPQPDLTSPVAAQDERPFVASDAVEAEPSVGPTEFGMATQFVETDSVAPAAEPESSNNDSVWAVRGRRRSLVQKMRDWLQGTA